MEAELEAGQLQPGREREVVPGGEGWLMIIEGDTTVPVGDTVPSNPQLPFV